MSPWDKPEWQDDLEADEADPYVEVIVDFAVLLLIAVFACLCAVVVYQMLGPHINTVIAEWSFVP